MCLMQRVLICGSLIWPSDFAGKRIAFLTNENGYIYDFNRELRSSSEGKLFAFGGQMQWTKPYQNFPCAAPGSLSDIYN